MNSNEKIDLLTASQIQISVNRQAMLQAMQQRKLVNLIVNGR
jgi:hypothetical protein